jgi:hypothetical protein
MEDAASAMGKALEVVAREQSRYGADMEAVVHAERSR